jgi:PPM family protein phosphatase
MTFVLNFVARSDRGLIRSNNEDSVYAGPRLLAIADGMGGHAAGEVASKIVIEAMAPLDGADPGEDMLDQLREAVREGNRGIAEEVAKDPELEGMGTTLTAILFAGDRLGLINVGDSRTYMVREGVLSQITRDQTFVQSLVDEGKITAAEAHQHPLRSLILHALTGQDDVEPALSMRAVREGDRYLLCSDGLSDVLTDDTIAKAMTISDLRACADRLIELALRAGGPDNVTVIVADVVAG